MAQASRIKTMLQRAKAAQSTQPSWPLLFWRAVEIEASTYGLRPDVLKLLQGHGFIGVGTISAPRTCELSAGLDSLETNGAPTHGAAAMRMQLQQADATFSNPEEINYHLKLPPDLQRAAPELYVNIRSEGATSVRGWVTDQFPAGARDNPQFQDLFTSATVVDFETAPCKTEQALMKKLASSDVLEVNLRKLASYVHYQRTKDKHAANLMLGIRAPGTGTDIAPRWLVDSAGSGSKMEYKARERPRPGPPRCERPRH